MTKYDLLSQFQSATNTGRSRDVTSRNIKRKKVVLLGRGLKRGDRGKLKLKHLLFNLSRITNSYKKLT